MNGLVVAKKTLQVAHHKEWVADVKHFVAGSVAELPILINQWSSLSSDISARIMSF